MIGYAREHIPQIAFWIELIQFSRSDQAVKDGSALSAGIGTLFFKFKNAGASFKANSGKVSINRSALTGLGPSIRSKVRAYQTDYLSTVLSL